MRTKNIFITAIFSIIAIFASVQTPVAHASATDNVFGYAWSSTTGFISMNNCTSASSCSGTSYGVKMDTSGNLSGYGWSSNLGYISFAGDNTHANPSKSGNFITGWIRACAVYASNCSGALKDPSYLGGWDGWIRLSDPADPSWGVKIDSTAGTITGNAWGSDVVGWVSFNLTTTKDVAPISVTLVANPTVIKTGMSSTLTWASTGSPTTCIGTNFNTGGATSGSLTITYSTIGTYNYTVTCTKAGTADAVATAKVVVKSNLISICRLPRILDASNNCTCPNGGTYDASMDICTAPVVECTAPLVLDPVSNTCKFKIKVKEN